MRNPHIVVIALCLVSRRRLRGVTGSHHSPLRDHSWCWGHSNWVGLATASQNQTCKCWRRTSKLEHPGAWNHFHVIVPRTLWDGPKSLNTSANIQSSMSPKLDILLGDLSNTVGNTPMNIPFFNPSFACRTPWHGGTCRRDMLSWCVPRTVPRTPSLRHGLQLLQQPRRDRDRPGRCYQRRRWRQWNFQKQSWDLSTKRIRKDGGCWKYDVPICSADHRSDHSRIFKATMFNGINGYSNGWFPNHPKSWSLGDRIGFLSQELVFVQPNCNDN